MIDKRTIKKIGVEEMKYFLILTLRYMFDVIC